MASNKATDSSDASEKAEDVDELLESLGVNDPAPPSGVGPDRPIAPAGKRIGGMWIPIVGVAVGVAILALAAAFLVGGSESGDGSETAAEAIDEASASAADDVSSDGADSTIGAEADLAAEAAELREVVARLGLDGIDIDVRDGTIHLAGTVPSEQDLSALRTAVISTSDPTAIDLSGIEVVGAGYGDEAAQPGQAPANGQPPAPGQAPGPGAPPRGAPPPGAPPPGFVPPTPEQQDALQAELNRVLAETPLVFDPGSTELNELQLEVLDTVIIRLLEAHPGVPVRLVGYTDQTGSDYDNSLLSFARATAVSDYLISRGVPEFILRPEGRGEDDASGVDGADRRVEIEVIPVP